MGSVGKIALGVFLGNLAFAVVAWFVIGMFMDSGRAAAGAAEAKARYDALRGEMNSASSPPR